MKNLMFAVFMIGSIAVFGQDLDSNDVINSVNLEDTCIGKNISDTLNATKVIQYYCSDTIEIDAKANFQIILNYSENILVIENLNSFSKEFFFVKFDIETISNKALIKTYHANDNLFFNIKYRIYNDTKKIDEVFFEERIGWDSTGFEPLSNSAHYFK